LIGFTVIFTILFINKSISHFEESGIESMESYRFEEMIEANLFSDFFVSSQYEVISGN